MKKQETVSSGIFDSIIDYGKEYILGKKEDRNFLGRIVDYLKGDETPKETTKKIEEIQETAKEERGSLFKEVLGSGLKRYFPSLSKIIDTGRLITGQYEEKDEAYALEHEFEGLTALTMFVPDSFLKILTDPLVNSEIFQKIVDKWPELSPNLPIIGKGEFEELKEKIKDPKSYDPDDVISLLRIMHQDLMTSKMSFSKVVQLVS